MAKKKRSTWNFELKNIIAGWILLFLTVLVAFWDTTSLIGKYLVEGLTFLLGDWYRAIFVPLVWLLSLGIILGKLSWNSVRIIGLLLYFLSITSLVAVVLPYASHGVFDFSPYFIGWFGKISALLALTGGFLVSLYLTLRISYRQVLAAVQARLPSRSDIQEGVSGAVASIRREVRENNSISKTNTALENRKKDLEIKLESLRKEREKETTESVPSVQKIAIEKKNAHSMIGDFFGKKSPGWEKEDTKKWTTPDFGVWQSPPLSVLHQIVHKNLVTPAEIAEKSSEIEHTLLQFKIEVEMTGQKVGPTVVQYRLRPADGVKLSKIENLKKDLTLALKAKSIRIQAPIPGLGLVGIEVPNDKRDMIGIREVLESPVFTGSKIQLPLAVGKDINGDYIVGDLAKMPHLLIAGQTGSGKSVGMNGFLVSLLFRNSPSELRMILIDPKRVELGIYNGIPHLLTPVINDPDKALNALKWSVTEMIRRYDILNVAKVRNLTEYNAKASRKDKMPNIVIVIDELADLMMSGNKKEVETTIARIAQMARAVGMHLIVATQRPSVDVITGLIKANIPSRIAFTVASLTDSRTILDRMGAEDLLGNGDMLYSPSGTMSPERIQGVYVSTEEVEAVVNHVKRTIDPAMLEDIYDASIVEGDRGNWEGSVGGGSEWYDEDPKVLEEAIGFVRSAGKASTSMLQRRMKLGYARAARVMDILEEMGIVGPADGSKPREVIG